MLTEFVGITPEAFQFMAAMCFEFTALILILGLTGWGKILVEKIPNGLKAGIILVQHWQLFIKFLKILMRTSCSQYL